MFEQKRKKNLYKFVDIFLYQNEINYIISFDQFVFVFAFSLQRLVVS